MEFNATFIVSAISFVIFSILMNAIFYKPLSSVVAQRQKFIEEANEDAKKMHKKADAVIRDKESRVEKAKHDAKNLISAKSAEVNAQKSGLASDAQRKAVEEIASAKESINQTVNDAQQGLNNEVNSLANEISSKILGTV